MDDSRPFFSVVIPTYNRRSALARALDSVLSQTFARFEVLVVDDGSTDGTVEFVAAIADERIRVLVGGSNRGASVARNEGIQAASAPWVAFLDSDDAWRPSKLETFYEAITRHPDIRVWYSGSANVGASGVETRSYLEGIEGDLANSLSRENPIRALPSVVVQTDLLREIGGFDPLLPSRQDIDLYYRLARRARFGFIPQALTVVYSGEDHRISSSPGNRLAGWIRFYEKHRGTLSWADRAYYHKRIFVLAMLSRRWLVAARFALGAMPGLWVGSGDRPPATAARSGSEGARG